MNDTVAGFLKGAGSILNIAPGRNAEVRIEPTLIESDRERIAGDWYKVGDDLRHASKRVEIGKE